MPAPRLAEHPHPHPEGPAGEYRLRRKTREQGRADLQNGSKSLVGWDRRAPQTRPHHVSRRELDLVRIVRTPERTNSLDGDQTGLVIHCVEDVAGAGAEAVVAGRLAVSGASGPGIRLQLVKGLVNEF